MQEMRKSDLFLHTRGLSSLLPPHAVLLIVPVTGVPFHLFWLFRCFDKKCMEYSMILQNIVKIIIDAFI